MPHHYHTIVVNQGDFETNVPEGNTVQEILPGWDERTEIERQVENAKNVEKKATMSVNNESNNVCVGEKGREVSGEEWPIVGRVHLTELESSSSCSDQELNSELHLKCTTTASIPKNMVTGSADSADSNKSTWMTMTTTSTTNTANIDRCSLTQVPLVVPAPKLSSSSNPNNSSTPMPSSTSLSTTSYWMSSSACPPTDERKAAIPSGANNPINFQESAPGGGFKENDKVNFRGVQGVQTMMKKMTMGLSHGCDLWGFNVASNKGWGIPPGMGLRGGGLNSLNNGTSGWGAPPSNTNAASATGWGAPPGSGGSSGGNSAVNVGAAGSGNPSGPPGALGIGMGVVGAGPPAGSGQNAASSTSTASSSPPGSGAMNSGAAQSIPSANNNHTSGSNQWASTSPNRNTSQNTNGQPTISGSQMNNNPTGNASGGPGSGNPMQMNNQNMVGSVMNSGNPIPSSVGTNPNQNSGGNPNSGGLITNTGSSSWAQAAGKSLQASGQNTANNNVSNINNPGAGNQNTPNSMNTNIGGPGGSTHGNLSLGQSQGPQVPSQPANAANTNVTSKQIEQLNSMREALFSHDGWGGQNVNQDSGWDIPGSPEPTHKDLNMGGGSSSTAGGAPAAGGSGQPTSSSGAAWKVNVNNGTDLWEANLRNGGAPPPQQTTQKAPWGHTPTSNIGGTWGEEDDVGDTSNVWTGVPPPSSNAPGGNSAPQNNNSGGSGGGGGGVGSGGQMQWGMNTGPPPPMQREPNNGMWPSAPMKKDNNDWGGGGRGIANDRGVGMPTHDNVPGNWGDRNNVHGGGGRMNNGGVDPNQGMWNKPQPPPQQQQPNQQQQQQQQQQNQNQWGGGPPVGVGQGHGGHGGHGSMGMGQGGMGNPGGHGGHGVGGLKDNMGNMGKPSGSGWDDVSPPTQRRAVPNIPNYDDGTSLWGNPMPGQQQQPQQPQQQQQHQRGMPPNRGMPNKMDGGNPMNWGGHNPANRNGWPGPDGPQDGFNNSGLGGGMGGGGGWNEDKSMNSWGEPPMQQNNSWAKPKTPTNPSASGWIEDGQVDVSSWGVQPKNSGSRYVNGSANSSKDLYWPNRLADMGYKKEELEMALRSSNMNLTDAIDSLDTLGGGGGLGMGGVGSGRGPPMDRMDQSAWPMQQQRRGPPPPPDDHFDLSLGMGPGGPVGMGPPPQQRGGFPGNTAPFPGGANSLMNNVANPSLASINPSLLQKILTNQPNPPQAFNTGRVQPNNTTSPRQLSLLVQQIQMAVQAGYLSSQILQHPLPQQSLYLLNQLLQNIKIFQQLNLAQQQIGKTNSPAALQLSVQITKTKQQITNLHNQIAAQQALHAKQQQQQQQQQHHHLAVAAAAAAAAANQPNNPNNDFFKPPIMGGSGGGGSGGGDRMIDPMISALQSNFPSDFGLEKGGQHQTSRLTQWTKLPSLEKDDANAGSDFSRAPGPQSNNQSAPPLLKNSSLGLGQSDNTWSSIVPRSGSDGWPTGHPTSSVPPSNNSNMNLNDDAGKNNSGVNMNADAWPNDLVPEFEPGKPWKGNQIMKTVEDDPTITPGSVVRSPLSLAAIKDTSEIFGKNSSPPSAVSAIASDQLQTPLSLNSDTWSFTPTSSGSANMGNPMGKLNPGKGVWDDMTQRNLWDYSGGGGGGGSGGVPGSRPPPGLPKKAPGQSTPTVTASGNVSSATNSNSFNAYRNSNNIWGSNQPSGGGGNGGGNNPHYWLLLKNLTPQIDGSTLKTLCVQHGPLLNFQLYQSHGVALVRYTTREEAAKAQNALNNCVLGNTTILADTAGENDVHNLTQGSSGGSGGGSVNVNSSQPPPNNSGGSYSSGNTGGRSGGNENPWGVLRDSSPLWSSSPWGSAGLDGPDRATPSSLNSLLPGDLLGGESA